MPRDARSCWVLATACSSPVVPRRATRFRRPSCSGSLNGRPRRAASTSACPAGARRDRCRSAAAGRPRETQIVFFPQINVYGPYERRRYYNYGGSGGGARRGGGGCRAGTPAAAAAVGGSGGAGDGKAAAIAILVAAAVALVAAAAVEGSRFDGYAQLHPMHAGPPVRQRRRLHVVMPLAWIDPQTAAWADHAIVRATKARGHELERAPLDRDRLDYAMFGGIGTLQVRRRHVEDTARRRRSSSATSRAAASASSARSSSAGATTPSTTTLFESRYTLELQGYPIHAGPLHLGLYGGGGAAYRFEDGIPRRQRRLDRADRRRDGPARHQHAARAHGALRPDVRARRADERRAVRPRRLLSSWEPRSGTSPSTRRTACRRSSSRASGSADLDAALGGGRAIPLRQAVPAEPREVHDVDVLNVGALAKMLHQPAKRRGLDLGARGSGISVPCQMV